MSRFEKKNNNTRNILLSIAVIGVIGLGVGVTLMMSDSVEDYHEEDSRITIPQWEFERWTPTSHLASQKKSLLNSIPKPILKKIFLQDNWRTAILGDLLKIEDNYETYVNFMVAIESYGGDYNAVHKSIKMVKGKKVYYISKNSARGKYQLIPDIAEELRIACKIDKSKMWEPENQDAMIGLLEKRNVKSCLSRDESFEINMITRWFMHNQGARGAVAIWKYINLDETKLDNTILKNICNNIPLSYRPHQKMFGNMVDYKKLKKITSHNYSVRKYRRMLKTSKKKLAEQKLKKIGNNILKVEESLVLSAYGYKSKEDVVKTYITAYMTMLENFVENGKLH